MSNIVDDKNSEVANKINGLEYPAWVPVAEQFCRDFWPQITQAPQIKEAYYVWDGVMGQVFGYPDPTQPLDPIKGINAAAIMSANQTIVSAMVVEALRVWELTQHPEDYKKIIGKAIKE